MGGVASGNLKFQIITNINHGKFESTLTKYLMFF